MKQIESGTVIETMPLTNTRKTTPINNFYNGERIREMVPVIPNMYK